MTASVWPPSRCSSVSPTHTIGVSPASRAAWVFLNTVSFVSPKYWRRSLWPIITCEHPRLRIIGPDTSPVYAPSFAQNRFCAPIPMRVPCAAATAAGRLGKGGQIAISQCSERSTRGRNFSKKTAVSAAVLYIFQLPAITGFLLIRSLVRNWFLSRDDNRSSRRRSGRGRTTSRGGPGERRALPEDRRPGRERIRG